MLSKVQSDCNMINVIRKSPRWHNKIFSPLAEVPEVERVRLEH